MSRSNNDSPSGDFHLEGRAKKKGQVIQLGSGTQNVVLNYHYGDSRDDSARLRPFDLPNLRLWINRIISDYTQLISDQQSPSAKRETTRRLRQLDALYRSVNDPPKKSKDRDFVRRLLAGGVAQYLSRAGQLPAEPLPEQIILDVTIFALWPIIEAPNLPPMWQQDLAELTSPRIASHIAAAREAKAAGNRIDVETLARELSDQPFTDAVLSLFEDLADPMRGGPALTAIALASGLPEPPYRGGAKATMAWVFVTLMGAAIGTATYDLDEKVNDLLETINNQAPTGYKGHQSAMPGHHHGGGSAPSHQQGGGHALDDFFEELLHDFFH